MKIQLVSDLHLENIVCAKHRVNFVAPAPDADVLVLAGDIHRGARAVELFADWPVPVLYVPGNHEFFHSQWEETRQDLRSACNGTNITLLDNDAVELGGVRFLGCTLWTKFKIRGYDQATAMRALEDAIGDYHAISKSTGHPFSPADSLADHERSSVWLNDNLARHHPGHTVVITHHGPHPRSVDPFHAGHLIDASYVSDLTHLLRRSHLWLHGHAHHSFDYKVAGCRVVANPAGFAINGPTALEGDPLELQNVGFNPALVLDLGDETLPHAEAKCVPASEAKT